MKKHLLLFIIFTQLIYAQENFEVEKLASRIRLSGEFINMHNEPNIGFLGHGYEVFGLLPKYKSLYFGVNSYSALTGIRSGFIVFGVSAGVQKQLYKNWLSYDVGLYLGGGGGSGAPDGGGLMVRPHVDLQASITKNISLRTGISAITFPSGAINSLNLNIGAVINANTYLINKKIKEKSTSNLSLFNNLELGASSLNLINFKKGPLRADNPGDPSIISLVGLTLKSYQKNNTYGVLKLGGAFVGGVDGFMMLLSGIGYHLPVNNWFFVNSSALIGGAGGGDVDFGGGLATQLEVGFGVKISDYYFQVNGGNTYAPNGNFKSNHIDISLGKRFKMYKTATDKKNEIVSADQYKKETFNFSIFNRSYISQRLKDKNGRFYDRIFNLIGFELEKKITNNLGIVAATVWAYQGNYGAYAEGWIGLQYGYPISDQLKITTKGLIGAGGGGGIDLGSGMAYQYAIGIEKNINERWSFLANIGQVRPVLDGSFTPILLDVGVKLNLSQLVKK